MKFRALIADDEAHARSRLRQLLSAEDDFEVVAECSHGEQALERVRSEHPDVAFLDIQMPRMTGMEVCSVLAGEGASAVLPQVVFVTAFDAYAVRAFECHAVDYLLKPFDQERFRRTLDRVRKLRRESPAGVGVDRGELESRLLGLLDELRRPTASTDRILLKVEGKTIFLRPEDIDWVEADGNYVRFHTGGQSHHVRETLQGVETRLDPRRFLRISRSVIVRFDQVRELQPLFDGDQAVILRDGTRLQMTRNYRARLDAFTGGKGH